ncbi:MAG: 23S rRNA (uracil(1939)-C(5))-methyltransferase RlmD [Acidobacteriota bacterium]
MISEGNVYDLKIEDLGYGGRGLARISSFVIWVDGALPGDRVRAKVVNRKPNYAQAKVLEFLEYSDKRITPRCKHHKSCGGCQLIEMKYTCQLDYKKKQIADLLIRIAGEKEPKLRDILPSAEIYRYRNRMEFSFGFDAEGKVSLGLHLPGCHDMITGIRTCSLQSLTADRILKRCADFFSELEVRKSYGGEEDLRHLLIREGRKTGEFLVALTGPSDYEDSAGDLAEVLKKGFPEVKTFVFKGTGGKKGMKGEDETKEEKGKDVSFTFMIFFGDGTIEEEVGGLRFLVDSDCFFQANTKQMENILRIVREFAAEEGVSSIIDLYCGSGAISLSLSSMSGEVLGIDNSRPSIQAAIKNARRNNITNCEFLCMDAGAGTKGLTYSNSKYDLAVVNPPRSGMQKNLIANLGSLSPDRIIYVSCNPSTLARDIRFLKELGYKLVEVVPADMFPHTYHIESVSYMKKSG